MHILKFPTDNFKNAEILRLPSETQMNKHLTDPAPLTFSLSAHPELVETAINTICAPDGVEIRPVHFISDIRRIHEMELGMSGDRIHPAYGMTTENDDNTICLIAERDGRVVGQISCDVEISGVSETTAELWISGIFVSAPERGHGIAFSLGTAAILICEAWRRVVAEHHSQCLEGTVDVSADTESGSGGEAFVDKCQIFAMDLEKETVLEYAI